MGQLMSSGPPLPLKEWKPHTPKREKGSLGLNLSLLSTNRDWVDALELEVFLVFR